MITCGASYTIWEVTGEIVIAVAGLSSTINTSENDIGGQRISSAVDTIGDSWARENASGFIVDNLSASNCS